MDAEVAVAEREPGLAVERAHGVERVPRLSGAPPAALLVVEPGERVEDRVEIRRDVEPQHLDVVADIPDDGDVPGADRIDDAEREACAADAAGEDDDLHAGASCSCRSRQARVREPSRSEIRPRSSSVSTSSTRFWSATVTTSRPSDAAWARKRPALPAP